MSSSFENWARQSVKATGTIQNIAGGQNGRSFDLSGGDPVA